jgi:hypothetical protein
MLVEPECNYLEPGSQVELSVRLPAINLVAGRREVGRRDISCNQGTILDTGKGQPLGARLQVELSVKVA